MPTLEYPKTLFEFIQWFPNEEACETYLYKSRWPDGFICPICGDREFYHDKKRKVFRCKNNNHQTSLTAGTIMHRSRQPILSWFLAAYLLTSETPGMSAIQLQRQLGIKRYETVFNLMHKLRASMVNPDREKIGNVVEIDDTYVGGTETGGKRGRGTDKAVVIVAVERQPNGHAGRIRLRKLKNMTEGEVLSFLKDNIRQGTLVITDSFPSYQNITRNGYQHRQVIGSGTSKTLPLAHLAISNLKTWLKGIFHGVSKKHLQAYLNEFVFRFNRRFYPMAGFRTLLGLSPKVKYPTYQGLYKGRMSTSEHSEKEKSMTQDMVPLRVKRISI